jgi:hypothetical protein
MAGVKPVRTFANPVPLKGRESDGYFFKENSLTSFCLAPKVIGGTNERSTALTFVSRLPGSQLMFWTDLMATSSRVQ